MHAVPSHHTGVVGRSPAPGIWYLVQEKNACVVDGTVVKIEVPRKNSVLLRSTWNNKSSSNVDQGIAWTSPCGLMLRYTNLFCGRLSEKAQVWPHRRLLDAFPTG